MFKAAGKTYPGGRPGLRAGDAVPDAKESSALTFLRFTTELTANCGVEGSKSYTNVKYTDESLEIRLLVL